MSEIERLIDYLIEFAKKTGALSEDKLTVAYEIAEQDLRDQKKALLAAFEEKTDRILVLEDTLAEERHMSAVHVDVLEKENATLKSELEQVKNSWRQQCKGGTR